MIARSNRLRTLGPGLLLAGAAIGVSHLVQATRAGADFGYQLLVIVLLVNLFKYPFFECGHRYAVATGENLLVGYRRLGTVFLYVFFAFSTVTSIISIAGVTFVTAGLAQFLFASGADATTWSAVLMVVCLVILGVGRYAWLDLSMKVIMAVLTVATLAAFAMAVAHGPVAPAGFEGPSAWQPQSLPFIIALMGWMPAPIEVSVFQSLWLEAQDRRLGRRTTPREAAVDFNVGYGLTVFLAVVFLALGALIMHGSGVAIENSGAGFAGQLVGLYRQTLGAWAGPIIAVAAFTTMFSTTLTVIDAYPRSLAVTSQLVWRGLRIRFGTLYLAWLLTTCAVALAIIEAFLTRLTVLVDLASSVAFLTAPVFAFLNYRLITSEHTPPELRPGRLLQVVSWLGLAYFIGFGMVFVWFRFLA